MQGLHSLHDALKARQIAQRIQIRVVRNPVFLSVSPSEESRCLKILGPPGDGPPDFHFGTTPVRLDPNGAGEVVWAHRIDPARSRIISVPLPATDYNHGDVLLTDGAPDGHRVVNGRELPVFNVLTRLAKSQFRKFVVELASATPDRVDALVHHADVLGGVAEHWGQSTRILCADCSRGIPHQHEPDDSEPAHPHCGLAARDATHAETIIAAWLANVPGLDVIRWFEVNPRDNG